MTSSARTDGLPCIDDVRAAAARIAGTAVRTPLLESPRLNDRIGARVLLKCEMFQPMGAFKIRGAWNRIAKLPKDERRRGVIAFSSGNHAQAVALTAQRFGIPATIVMPSNAPAVKIANTRAYGAEVTLYDRDTQDREAIADDIISKTGAALVPPYDHPDVMAGQGTLALEIVEQCGEMGLVPDVAVVPCSGGGLIAGCAIAFHDVWPDMEIHAAEPAGFNDTARSLASNARERNEPGATSICDALLVETPGELTFAINRTHLSGGADVTDGEVMGAMRTVFEDARLVVEPGGAAGLAAVLHRKIDVADRTVCVVLSGGNVDAALFSDAIRGS